MNLELRGEITSCTTSYAEYHKKLVDADLVFFDLQGCDFMKNPKEVLPFLSDPDTCLPVGDEEKVVLPHWKKQIPKLNERLEAQSAEVKFYDSHKKQLLGNKSPDIVLLRASGLGSCFNIVVVGELKGCINDAFKGQLEKYLSMLLDRHTYRNVVYGFLTDNKSLLVVRACRLRGNITFTWLCQEQWNGGDAASVLSCLAFSSLADLGYCLPEVYVDENVQLVKYLGHGLSGHVYEGKWKGQSVVVKVHKDEGRMKREQTNLQYLKQNNVENVAKLVGVDKEHLALLLTPVAEPLTFSSLNCQHIHKLVHTLLQIHKLGLVHCDVKQSNIFVLNEQNVLLNDLGSAINTNAIAHEGVLLEASDYILNFMDSKLPVKPRPQDDLHALARSVYLNDHPKAYIKRDHSSIRHFWKCCPEVYQNIFELAENSDCTKLSTYDSFAAALASVAYHN